MLHIKSCIWIHPSNYNEWTLKLTAVPFDDLCRSKWILPESSCLTTSPTLEQLQSLRRLQLRHLFSSNPYWPFQPLSTQDHDLSVISHPSSFTLCCKLPQRLLEVSAFLLLIWEQTISNTVLFAAHLSFFFYFFKRLVMNSESIFSPVFPCFCHFFDMCICWDRRLQYVSKLLFWQVLVNSFTLLF